MSLESGVQYFSMLAALAALYIGRRGMKPYVPVAVFASLYTDLVCDVGVEGLYLWTYPARLAPFVQESLPAGLVVVPVIAMFWVRYCPRKLWPAFLWALAWAVPLTLGEYYAERHTQLIEYLNGYDWYHSFLLWLLSFAIWRSFHLWLTAK